MGQSVESLTLEQRVAHYREMAGDALRRAGEAETFELRASYVGLASDWKALADNVEHMIETDGTVPSILVEARLL